MNIYEFAVQMELDGEKYYSEQAGKSGKSLRAVLEFLAKEERHHAELLISLKDGGQCELSFDTPADKTSSVFFKSPGVKNEIMRTPQQLDFYREALKKERDSIDLYEKMQSGAKDEREQNLCAFLVKEERKHYAVLDQMVLMLEHAQSWVESAEFGVREEY